MSFPTMFLAFALLAQQAQPQEAGSQSATLQTPTTMSPDTFFPAKPVDTLAAEVLGWRGWSYLQGLPGAAPKPYESDGDWTNLRTKWSSIKPPRSAIWKTKFVIFTRIESDDRDAKGVLREHRQTLESVQLAQVQAAIERFKAWITTRFDGHVTLIADIQTETDWMRDPAIDGVSPFGIEFAKHYLEARVNGGSYESEDKIFRGPYNSVIAILPGAGSKPLAVGSINLTPLAEVNALPTGPNGDSLNLDSALMSAWLAQVETRAKEQGYKGISLTKGANTADDVWASIASTDEAPPAAFLSHLNATAEIGPTGVDPQPVRVPKCPETEATLFADPDRGQVLKFVEAAGYRGGGLALPSRQDGMPIAKLESAPTLSFQVKSTCGDPISIHLTSSEGKSIWISIGPDPTLVSSIAAGSTFAVPFTPDGKWQKVLVDLKSIGQKVGFSDVLQMAIEPSPNSKLAGKMRPELIEYEFDEFKFSSDPAQPLLADVSPDASSLDPEARALYAAQAKAPSAELGALLRDKMELVRLNATAAYTKFKDPSIESSLVSNSLDLDPSIAATALVALMFDGSDNAISVVRQSVRVAFSDYAKQTAATLLAQTKDPKMAGEVSLLLSNRSWTARVAGVEALALIGTPAAGQISLAFINGNDPEIKLAVTRHADPSRDEDVRILLWSAVNEPYDMVRAQSDIKLIQSQAPANRTEGYKGVRDDSKFVRLQVLQYLASQPKEEHRNALRIAVADRSPMVRAAALNGFAALDAATSLDEVANVLEDSSSTVQLALIDLAEKKHLKLPQKTIDAMLASGDPRVATAAKGLTA